MNIEFQWDKSKYQDLVDACKDNAAVPYLLEFLPKSDPVLEAGCGLGHFVRFLSDLSYNAYGIEIGKNTVKMIMEVDPNLRVICGSIEEMPFPTNFFGGVMCLGVVEHITEGPEKALNEIYRVMKPGGMAIISVPVFNTLRQIKYYSGIYFLEYSLRKIIYEFSGRKVNYWFFKDARKTDVKNYHFWPPYFGSFFEYRFTRDEILRKIIGANFKVIKEVPLENIEGLYHEFGGKIVDLKKPSIFVRFFDKLLSKILIDHNHMYLVVVQKP